MDTRLLRVTLYLFCGLLGLSLSGLLPHPLLGEAVLLVFCALPVACEKGKGETALFPLLPRRRPSSLLFFPLLLGVTMGVSALTALLFPSITPAYPALSPLTIVTSAIAPALAEELLFRFLVLSMLLPYGKRRAVLLNALLFALFHQSLYQMPYALAAGAVLAAAALYSDSLALPVLLHFANNLLSLLIGAHLTLPLVLLFVSAGIGSGIALFFLNKGNRKEKATGHAPLRPLALSPLLLYALYSITMAVLRSLGT